VDSINAVRTGGKKYNPRRDSIHAVHEIGSMNTNDTLVSA